jgi:SAM-dependent methyltransferase
MTREILDGDPYLEEVHRWWHLTAPSPELVDAERSGWLGAPGVAVDVGCGLGSEVDYLTRRGWEALGVDLSFGAVARAAACTRGSFVQGNVLQLPLTAARADVVLDRGCLHYVPAALWKHYASEVARVLVPGGRFLLRACLQTAGARNSVTDDLVLKAFVPMFNVDSIVHADIPSDTRLMPAIVLRLTNSGR